MLKIKNLTAGYGGPIIIENINIEVREGEIVTMIGPNGAGKSTILKSIFGLTKIADGEILFFNQNIVGLKTSEITGYGICYVPQGRSIFPSLTVEENLEMGAYIRKDKKEIANDLKYVYSKFPRLHERRNQKARNLSGGEQQMAALGRALMLKPQLLLLDEPSIGLAPKIVAEVFEKILEIRQEGTSILIVEQNAFMALKVSDRAYALELGKNLCSGTGKELLSDPQIQKAYLGKNP
ncbi:ABC transporter ATP-binding protein [Candidatus Peregrinibacteria bacterium]|nr:ABC transporter ATP-binding protein [Candidatus Peregrinibacteria bacterium]